ncbi:MAG TPA: TIGR02302 family protein, partial [Reyranella sp.]|nr:TIGR02302 family protein [Reyranella sp.]
MTASTPELNDRPPDQGRALLSRALARARWSILWERLWPALATFATAGGLFLAASWLGLWLWLPPIGRAIGLLLFVVFAVAAAVPLFMVRLPRTDDGLRRLDRNSRLPHRPATAIADELVPEANDSFSSALWRAHMERALTAARTLRAGPPRPRLAARDPYALRALTLVLAVATFFAAGNERWKRVAAAFDWQGVVAPANFRIDAWVTPPTYTGRPPQILPGLRPGETARQTAAFSVPAGSTLVVRSTGKADFNVAVAGGVAEAPGGDARPQAPAGTEERRYIITDTGSATVRGVGENLVWSFTAIPDRIPVIALAKEPEGQSRGALQLNYKIEDDYGVIDAQATFERKPSAKFEVKAPRPLFGAPDFTLVLPQSRTKNGVGQTIKDLTEHPWAGVDVAMILIARDEASNEGRSLAHELRLPERPFVKPLARALIEQRRELALDANTKPRVLTALDALSIAPERFTPETNIYLGLRSIYWHLARAKDDDGLREVVARLWGMAVNIEDGNVSEAEQALRAAQDALRQALERGATDEELKKLMDQLRAALDKFLQALAEEMRKNPQMARPLDPNSMRNLRSQDLRSMLDRMERMARSGQKDAARQLLDQLQQMLENLQMARPGGETGEDGDEMQSALDELADMIRKQQQLRDRTFRQGQDQRRQQRGQRGQQQQQPRDPNSMGELRQDQQSLRDQLSKLLEELRKRGFPQPGQQGQPGQPGENGEMDQLGRAGEAMGDAQGSLGDGDADGAVDSQGRALDALRRGAQGMAQSMQQQMGQGQGPGTPGRTGQPRAQQNTDPLGRPLRGRDYGDDTTVKV